MAGSIFSEKSTKPDDAMLAETLGATRDQWDALVAHVSRRCDGLEPEWKHYGKKHGWQLKFTHKRRALLWMVPHDGSFLAGLSLRAPGVAALRETDLPRAFIEEIENGKPYMEGWAARVEVTGPEQAAMVEALLEIKLTA